MDQIFLTIRGVVHGSFRATLGVASVFVHVASRPGWGACRCFLPLPQDFFFGVNQGYLDFSSDIFDL